MDEIKIPYHLVLPTILSVLSLVFLLFKRSSFFQTPKKKLFWYSLSTFFLIYMIIVGIASFYDIYYQWDLNRYDLDQDGFFGGNEINKEQEAAMQRLTSDTGRNFSIITGFIFSAIISCAAYFSGKVLEIVKQSR